MKYLIAIISVLLIVACANSDETAFVSASNLIQDADVRDTSAVKKKDASGCDVSFCPSTNGIACCTEAGACGIDSGGGCIDSSTDGG